MRVLFIHPVSGFGGASKSLLELSCALKGLGCNITVLCPKGALASKLEQFSIQVIRASSFSQFDNTLYGHYRGLRWLILLREAWHFPGSLLGLLRAMRFSDYDLIHLNEITLLPIGFLAKRLFNLPLVVHVRSVQRGSNNDWRTRWINYLLRHTADAVVAIDETVRRSLPSDLDVKVVHNILKVDCAQSESGSRDCEFRVGMLGVLLRLKGCYEFLEAARILVNDRRLNIRFWVVGENARDMNGIKGWLFHKLGFSHDVRRDLEQFVEANNLGAHVELLGFRSDVQSIYRSLDLLCFPSYLNAVGRPVFEAAFFGVPSIVAARNPSEDVIIHGETGICIDFPDPVEIANAIEYFFNHRDDLKRMGSNARSHAQKNFAPEANSSKIYEIYRHCAA